eukprot:m.23156 g.23156  ORF g.23156 m.23156 type:complete len:364 (-) comp12910_c0_seq2:178-1269(-)
MHQKKHPITSMDPRECYAISASGNHWQQSELLMQPFYHLRTNPTVLHAIIEPQFAMTSVKAVAVYCDYNRRNEELVALQKWNEEHLFGVVLYCRVPRQKHTCALFHASGERSSSLVGVPIKWTSTMCWMHLVAHEDQDGSLKSLIAATGLSGDQVLEKFIACVLARETYKKSRKGKKAVSKDAEKDFDNMMGKLRGKIELNVEQVKDAIGIIMNSKLISTYVQANKDKGIYENKKIHDELKKAILLKLAERVTFTVYILVKINPCINFSNDRFTSTGQFAYGTLTPSESIQIFSSTSYKTGAKVFSKWRNSSKDVTVLLQEKVHGSGGDDDNSDAVKDEEQSTVDNSQFEVRDGGEGLTLESI